MRKLLLILMVFLCMAVEPMKRLDLTDSLVRVEAWNQSEWQFIGSASQIESRGEPFILTAWHVLEGNDFVRLCGHEKKKCVIASNSDYRRFGYTDVGAVPIPVLIAKPLDLDKHTSLSIGEAVYSSSYPQGVYSFTQGTVNSLQASRALLSMYCSPGSSGAPITNHRGKLVGVVTSIPIILGIPQTNLCIIQVL